MDNVAEGYYYRRPTAKQLYINSLAPYIYQRNYMLNISGNMSIYNDGVNFSYSATVGLIEDAVVEDKVQTILGNGALTIVSSKVVSYSNPHTEVVSSHTGSNVSMLWSSAGFSGTAEQTPSGNQGAYLYRADSMPFMFKMEYAMELSSDETLSTLGIGSDLQPFSKTFICDGNKTFTEIDSKTGYVSGRSKTRGIPINFEYTPLTWEEFDSY